MREDNMKMMTKRDNPQKDEVFKADDLLRKLVLGVITLWALVTFFSL